MTDHRPPGWLRWVAGATALGGCIDFSLDDQDEVVTDPIVVEEQFVQQPEAKVDILWVIDDTGSMERAQEALADAFGAFAAVLDDLGLAWQLGVTTTTVTGDDAGVLHGDPWILVPTTEDLDAALERAADVGTSGTSPEAGLGAAVLALSEPLASEDNRGFRRPDASLHVVVVSDSDDDSDTVLGSDAVEAFLEFLDEQRSETGLAATLSAVVGDVPGGCEFDGGAAQPGTAYVEVADASGGTVGSICEADFGPVAEAVGELSATWPDTFELQATPVEGSVRVEVDGARQDSGWSLATDPPAIVFDAPPAPGAEIGVRYEVAE